MIQPKTFWKTTFAFTFLVNLAILGWSIARWAELGVILYRSVWGAVLLIYLGMLASCIFLFYWMNDSKAEKFIASLALSRLQTPVWRSLGLGLFTGILLLIPHLKFTYQIGEVVKGSTRDPVLTMILFYWACWWLILLAASALKVAFKTSWQGGFAAALIILGIAYEVYIRFQAVTTYPFSMGWSEGSRYYYASLYFSQMLYGETFPLSSMHPTRYWLQSLAFLFPNLDLAGHRFWQVLLWIVMTIAAGVAVVCRTFTPNPDSNNPTPWTSKARRLLGPFALLLLGWLFLYYRMISVYYHLMPMVFLPLLFVSHRHPWRSLVVVVIASLWAGVSRVNWFPVPAMIAIILYLLEVPFSNTRISNIRLLDYLKLPALWTIAGLLSALAAKGAYIVLSGNADNAQAFTSSFTSDLIWSRLWPNELYPMGIVWGILVVSGPLLAVLVLALREWGRLHPIRWGGMLAVLLVLFGGGLVVSVKIGGGGDLHNMDGFAVLLSVVAALFLGGQVRAESASKEKLVQIRPGWPVMAIATLIPLFFLIPTLSPRPVFDHELDQARLEELKTLVETADGPVLFIMQRHLVTFGKIDVPLVPDYENVTLMEIAMSNNQQVLGQFYDDLRENRFAMIISDRQNLILKTEGTFVEEDNIWKTRISPYILCYYESAGSIQTSLEQVEIYVPRSNPEGCP
jgi:hypothetical protein